MGRKRTTFRDIRTLEIGSVSDAFAYGPETAKVYDLVHTMLANGRKSFYACCVPIIRSARQKYPKQEWWLIDDELAKDYERCWQFYKAWRREAYQVMEDAAWKDTLALFDAQEAQEPWPFIPSQTPKDAHEWQLELNEDMI